MSKHCKNDFTFVFYDGSLHGIAVGKEYLESALLDLKFWAGPAYDERLLHCYEIPYHRAKYIISFLREFLPPFKDNPPTSLDVVRDNLSDIFQNSDITLHLAKMNQFYSDVYNLCKSLEK